MTMREQMKSWGPYANVTGWEGALMALDEWLHLEPTRTQLSFLALGCAVVSHLVLKYGVPLLAIIYRGIRKRLAAWAGAGLVLFACSGAEASPVGITIECAKYAEALDPEGSSTDPAPTKECERRRLYFDLGVMFGGLAFKLDRPRELLAGFNAGTGYGFRWCPDFWTLTPAFLAIDVFLNAGYVAREGGDAVQFGLLGAVSLMNFLGAGLGYEWVLGFGDAPDMKTPIGTVGVATSF